MIDLKQITFSHHRNPIFKDLSLRFRPGAVHVIVGPNGAGKTSLLRLIAGLSKPDSGSVSLFGKNINRFRPGELAACRACLLQEQTYFGEITVADYIRLGCIQDATSTGLNFHEHLHEIADLLSCDVLLNRSYQTLSGGEKQRVHFARVLAQIWNRNHDFQGKILLVDEPTSAMDLSHQSKLFQVFQWLCERYITLVAITHELNLAARYADDIYMLHQGICHAQGCPVEVITPRNLEAVFNIRCNVVSLPYPQILL